MTWLTARVLNAWLGSDGVTKGEKELLVQDFILSNYLSFDSLSLSLSPLSFSFFLFLVVDLLLHSLIYIVLLWCSCLLLTQTSFYKLIIRRF